MKRRSFFRLALCAVAALVGSAPPRTRTLWVLTTWGRVVEIKDVSRTMMEYQSRATTMGTYPCLYLFFYNSKNEITHLFDMEDDVAGVFNQRPPDHFLSA